MGSRWNTDSRRQWPFGLVLALAMFVGCGGGSERPRSNRCDSDRACEANEVCEAGECVARDGSTATRDGGTCVVTESRSELRHESVDIIVVIDNSGSMVEEAAQTRENINRFAETIAESGADYRVVLISSVRTLTSNTDTGVCVPPPLGSGPPSCGSGREGRLLAVNHYVDSSNGPELAVRLYPQYRDFLRPRSLKAFIWITDDNSTPHTADSLRAELAALDPPGMFASQVHHAIVGYYGDTAATWEVSSAGSCGDFQRAGVTYLRLATCFTTTGFPNDECISGITARVCESDWTSIFDEVATTFLTGVPIECEFALPDAPDDNVLDHGDAVGTYSPRNEPPQVLTRTTQGQCSESGWHYDNDARPSRIVLCPALCARVRSALAGARLEFGFDCSPALQ